MTTNNDAVKITANKERFVVIPSENNPEFGYIRVEQRIMEFTNNWLTPKTRSAIISGKVTDLQSMGYKAGDVLPGRIQIIETLDAPDVPNPERFIKRSGTNGIPCTLNGDTIFRISQYDPKGESVDTFIQHNNVDEIKEFQVKQKNVVETANLGK